MTANQSSKGSQGQNVRQVHEAIFAPYVQRLIKDKARQLRRRPEFLDVDPKDLQQEVIVQVLHRARLFDPARSAATTFCVRAIYSVVATMCRDRNRLKRGANVSTWALETMIGEGKDGEEITLGDVVHETDLTRRSGNFQPDDLESCLLALDVADALRHLAPETREVAQLMMDEVREWEIAVRLGLSRRRVRHAVATIRACLEPLAKEIGQGSDETA